MEYISLITALAKLGFSLIKEIPKWITGHQVGSLEKERKALSEANSAIGWAKFLGK